MSGNQVPPPRDLLQESRRLSTLALFDIFILFLVVVPIIWNIDNENNLLLLFHVLHIITWGAALLLANNYTRSPGYTTAFIAIAVLALLLDLAGWGWRIARVVQCENGDLDIECENYLEQDIYTIVFVTGFAIIDVLYIVFGVWHRRAITAYYNRLGSFSQYVQMGTGPAVLTTTTQPTKANTIVTMGTDGMPMSTMVAAYPPAYSVPGPYGGIDEPADKGTVPPYMTPVQQGAQFPQAQYLPPVALPPAQSTLLPPASAQGNVSRLTTPSGKQLVHGVKSPGLRL